MKSFEEQLAVESAGWVGDGLVTEEQRNRLLARHPMGSEGGHRFLALLATIGGALFIVGVSLVIKSNWDEIGDGLKIGGLVALLLTLHAVGWRLRVAPGLYPKSGDACLMAGAVCFLLGIALVSQIFHLNSRPPNGVLLWWLGIAALPWLARARGAQFVSVVAGLTWLGMEFAARDSWLRLVVAPTLYHEEEIFLFASAAFLTGGALAFFGLGLRRGDRADFAGLHEKLGLILANWGLYALGFTWTQKNWLVHAMQPARLPPVFGLLALVAVAVLWAFRRNRRETVPLVVWLALGLVPVLAHLFGVELNDSGWLWGGLACVALFLLDLGMIRLGLATGREGWINLGMLGIALNVVTRYFLLFGTMLEGGVFFIVTGLLVLGLGYGLERKRRALVSAVRQEAAS
ncbi:MAG TPA: DUF2157 domain-containing protein [Opitutaceae bacterium]|nr:DUF2157 domain-containing protein [Opitutaceae bacterium]